MSTITNSTTKGKMLNMSILRTEAKDWEPRDTILIILPVCLFKWNASCYLCT